MAYEYEDDMANEFYADMDETEGGTTMHSYKDFSKKKYIDKDELQSDDVFICRNGNKKEVWKYIVAIEHENKCELLGKFELEYLARVFAGTVAALRDAINITTKEGVACCIK